MPSSIWNVDVLMPGTWRGASCVLLWNGRERILVDTGMPHDAHRVVTALQQRGLNPSQIRCVVNTHFHLDHVSNNCLFPGSVIYATQESYDWCQGLYASLADSEDWVRKVLKYYPELFRYPHAEELMGKLRNFGLRWWDVSRIGAPSQFRWVETHGLPDGIEFLLTSGHVPGHVSLILNGYRQPTVVAGDALLTRVDDAHVLTMIPHREATYQADRQQILSMPGKIIPGHDEAFLNPE
ncbi:MAG TPA: MBL fold metallo-hydrolase [Terriglobia bacterium]|nr:MBL fold metallo-hydrolase [Terriglobia bacterium]